MDFDFFPGNFKTTPVDGNGEATFEAPISGDGEDWNGNEIVRTITHIAMKTDQPYSPATKTANLLVSGSNATLVVILQFEHMLLAPTGPLKVALNGSNGCTTFNYKDCYPNTPPFDNIPPGTPNAPTGPWELFACPDGIGLPAPVSACNFLVTGTLSGYDDSSLRNREILGRLVLLSPTPSI